MTSITGIEAERTTFGAMHGTLADDGRLRRSTAREPMNAPSSTIDRPRLRRLEHAADADAAREVDVGADLRARADGRPRVDHRARPDPGADVHESRHEDDALGEKRAVASDSRRHDAHAAVGVVAT